MKKNITKIIIVISIFLIGGGLYLNYLSNPKKILGIAIKKLNTKAEKIIRTNYMDFYQKSFTGTSNINFNIKSDYLTALAGQSPEYSTYNNILKNLNNTKNTLTVNQNIDDKNMLLNFNSNLNNQELINLKYLIDSSKQYYFINGFKNNYTDAGQSNYFKRLEKTLTVDEVVYLYDKVSSSIEAAIKSEYFEKKDENGLYKISLKLTQTRIKEITKSVVNDLKKDSKAKSIIVDKIYKDFFTEIDQSIKQIEDRNNNYLLIDIYTSNFTYDIKNISLKTYENNKETSNLNYEYGKDKDLLTVKNDGKVMYKVEIIENNNNYDLTIFDSKDKKIGTGKILLKDDKTTITFNTSNEDVDIDIDYDVEIKNINDKSFESTIKLGAKVIAEKQSIIDGDISINSKIEYASKKIEENIINATSLTEEEENLLGNKLLEIFNKLGS